MKGWRYGEDAWAASDPAIITARPLVVIDPEDLQAIERLQDLYITAQRNGLSGLSMQAALREFADPKPPQCSSHVNIEGEDFQCVESEGHDGASHRSPKAQAVWGSAS